MVNGEDARLGRWLPGKAQFLRAVILLAACLPTGGCLPGLPDSGSSAANEAASFAPSETAPGVTTAAKANVLSVVMQSESRTADRDNQPAPASRASARKDTPAQSWSTRVAAAEEPEREERPEAPIAPPAKALKSFYSSLSALASGRRREPVVILHLGEDIVALDQFTGDLRAQFQSRFGDAGRGMVPPGVFQAHGIKFDHGGAWTLRSSAAGDPGLYGLTGVRMEASGKDSWIRLTDARGQFDWAEAMFGAGPGYGAALVIVDGEAHTIPTSAQKPDRTGVKITQKAREIVIRPRGDGPIALLSLRIGSDRPGIRYVSLGVPGATAATPGKWSAEFVSAELQRLKPDLIVLSYGMKEGFTDKLDVEDYRLRARFLVQQLKELAPQASFLLTGPPDAARLPDWAAGRGGQACRALNGHEIARYRHMIKSQDERLARWHAPPMLGPVRSALREVAATEGAFFWDWERMMGGPCSVHAWASATPPLASPDHRMLTEAGAERSARALFLELISGYEAYRRETEPVASAEPKDVHPASDNAKNKARHRPARHKN
jgi:hypothetical protein